MSKAHLEDIEFGYLFHIFCPNTVIRLLPIMTSLLSKRAFKFLSLSDACSNIATMKSPFPISETIIITVLLMLFFVEIIMGIRSND